MIVQMHHELSHGGEAKDNWMLGDARRSLCHPNRMFNSGVPTAQVERLSMAFPVFDLLLFGGAKCASSWDFFIRLSVPFFLKKVGSVFVDVCNNCF